MSVAPASSTGSRGGTVALSVISAVFALLTLIGLRWGLPDRRFDRFLFGGEDAWSGERIAGLIDVSRKFDSARGADVDVDPAAVPPDAGPVDRTASPADVAAIYLRYRLFTCQPDEMITMMALARMRPAQGRLDPQLYQYGGLFIYPVGALVRLGGLLGLVEVRADVPYYVDRPEEFGKFYLAARLYAAGFGMLGAWVVFALGRRLGGPGAGVVAALLYTLLPVVVCMAHEGKPHLPGAVLMLSAVLLGMRCLGYQARAAPVVAGPETSGAGLLCHGMTPSQRRSWWLMCACCGAAFGMVLSSWPIFVLIPLVAGMKVLDARAHARGSADLRPLPDGRGSDRPRGFAHGGPSGDPGVPAGRSAGREWSAATVLTVAGVGLGVVVYLATNPYLVINAFANRAVLASNFGNSLAMYQLGRLGEGLWRVLELSAEGATGPVLMLGVVGLAHGIARGKRLWLPLAVPALVFFLQFVAIGAGKPAEYGRFGVFPDTALAISTACFLMALRNGRVAASPCPLPLEGRGVVQPPDAQRGSRLTVRLVVIFTLVIGWTAVGAGRYLYGFAVDAAGRGSRARQAEWIARQPGVPIAVLADPAPYGCPPLAFADRPVLKFRSVPEVLQYARAHEVIFVGPVDSPAGCAEEFTQREAPPIHQECQVTMSDVACWIDSPISWANKPFCAARLEPVPGTEALSPKRK